MWRSDASCISVGCAEAVHVAFVFFMQFFVDVCFYCLFVSEVANDGVNDAYPTICIYIYI